MKSHNSILLCAILQDAESAIKGYSADRDVREILKRIAHEGDEFLSKTLPRLGDFLLDCLSGRATPPKGWKLKSGFQHPELFHALWSRIVGPDLVVLSNPCVESILFLRQVTVTFKKVFEVCADIYVTEALKGFLATDRELGRVRTPESIHIVTEVAEVLFKKAVSSSIATPGPWKHGPGAVSEKYDSVEKYRFDTVSPEVIDLEGYGPFVRKWTDYSLVKLGVVPARLVTVPKTALKPRLIAIEPTYNQFIQQGYHTSLKSELGRNRICGYSSQVPNQKLAREGSIDGGLSTIDLSEASDRVSYRLLRTIFQWSKPLLDVLEGTRSPIVRVPQYGMRTLHKFACMGSALTFPIEAMFFTSIVVAALCVHYGDFSPSFIRRLERSGKVRVYGDDIIVPTDAYPIVTRFLTDYGLVVNESKSFSSGNFRESCGADYYAGVDITPSYLRRNLPASRHQVNEIIGLVALRDQLYSRHLFPKATSFLTDLLIEMGGHGVPDEVTVVLETDTASRRYGEELKVLGVLFRGPVVTAPLRWNGRLQRSEYRFLAPVYDRRETRATSSEKLFKSLYELRHKPLLEMGSSDPQWISHDGRPTSAKLKRRWATVQ